MKTIPSAAPARHAMVSPDGARRPARRRFLCIAGSAAGLAASGALHSAWAGVNSSATTGHDLADDPTLHTWQGIALGGEATLRIHHPDASHAQRLIQRTVAELQRLESLFSLYRADSQLSRLNRDGRLDDPGADMLTLLGRSQRYSQLTHGAFDVTVQPLWQLYAEHFAQPGAAPGGPSSDAIDHALQRIGYQYMAIEPRQVRFLRPGMAATLNGIAQGYITDRITALLADGGVEHALVNMGEIRALNAPGQRDWRIGLEQPGHQGQMNETLALRNAAIATSGGYGTPLDDSQRFHHLLDPGSGRSGQRYLGVSVVAPTATTADALSTAFSLMPQADIAPLAHSLQAGVRLTLPDSSVIRLGALPGGTA